MKKNEKQHLPKVEIYTDGSYMAKSNKGACCAYLKYNDQEITVVYGEKETTNNRMELSGAIIALHLLKIKCEVIIYSDSKYVINPFKLKWIERWKKNNWKTSEGFDIKNKDLWLILDELVNRHKVTFIWVKGHSTNEGNNYCDKVAKDVSTNLKEYGF